LNSSRYYSLVAARALSAGRPLDQALEEAARIAPPAPPAVRAAIVHLKAGRLKNALEALRHVGVDPLLAQAGEICPKATSAVRTRLDTLPDAMVLSLPFRGMAVYLAIVFFIQASMGALLSRFPLLSLASRGAAAVILLGLGVWFVVQHGSASPPDERARHVRSSFAIGFGITALNPTFLATWTAAVTVLHSLAVVPPTLAAAAPFALGVAAGIVAWFALMLAAIARWRDRFQPGTVRRVLQVVGVGLLAMGAWAAVAFVRALAA